MPIIITLRARARKKKETIDLSLSFLLSSVSNFLQISFCFFIFCVFFNWDVESILINFSFVTSLFENFSKNLFTFIEGSFPSLSIIVGSFSL